MGDFETEGPIVDPVQREMALEPPVPAMGPGGVDAALGNALSGPGTATPEPGDSSDPKELIAPPPPAQVPNAPESLVGAPEMGPPAPQPATDDILSKLPAPGAPDAAALKPDPATGVTAEKVLEEKHQLDLQAAEVAKRQAEAARFAAIDHQADVLDATEKGNALFASRQKAYDESLQKYNSMKIRDYWDEPGHSKMQAGLAIALGGFSAALSARAGGSSVNPAIGQIDKMIANDFERQKAQIEQARDTVVMARTGINDAKEAKAALLEDVNAKRVASLQALETEARLQLAERGVPAAEIENHQAVLQLQAAKSKAENAAHEQKLKDAKLEAETAYINARAGKLKGSGGGGGGAMKPGAIAEFKKAIVEGKDGQPLNAAEIQAKADELGIPAVAKAGRPSVENLTKDVAFVAGQKIKADANAQKRDDAIDKDLQKELYPAGGRGPGTQLERIEAMRSELKDAIASGDKTAATRVLEEAGGMLSGGKSTKNTVHLLEELKSSSDKMSSMWGRITGNPGDSKAFTQRLDKLLDGAATEKRAEIEAIKKRHEERRAKIAGKGVSGKSTESQPDPLIAKAQKAIDDPKAPPAAKAAAHLYLRQRGLEAAP